MMSPTPSSRSSAATVVPPRPPPFDQEDGQEDYINFSTLEREQKRSIDEHYDIPKNWTAAAPPPPCIGANDKVHKYVNASTKIIREDNSDDMSSHSYSNADNTNLGKIALGGGGIDLNVQVRPANEDSQAVVPLASRAGPTGYLPMDQSAQQAYTSMSPPPLTGGDEDDDFYDVAPPSRPVDQYDDDAYDMAPPTRPVLKANVPVSTKTYNSRPDSDVYDVAPPTRPVNNTRVQDRPESDVYDVAPPSRPMGNASRVPPSQQDRPDSDVYDVVPATRALKVCKPTHPVPNQSPQSEDDVYDIAPPTRRVHNNTRPDSEGDIYDVAPPTRPVYSPRRNSPPVDDDIYDVAPPTRPLPLENKPPSRPPKPRKKMDNCSSLPSPFKIDKHRKFRIASNNIPSLPTYSTHLTCYVFYI